LSSYDAPARLNRAARVSALAMVVFLAVIALVAAILAFGWLGPLFFLGGCSIAGVESIVKRHLR
jgi:fatty acid desaturase